MILVSACLAGCDCRYNGGNCANAEVQKLVAEGKAFALCPEQLAGMPTPRDPHEIVRAADGTERVISKTGRDHTEDYQRGAEMTLAICQAKGVREAILKSRSPSCGSGQIHDGTFSGTLIQGDGLTARLLKANGIKVRVEA